VYIFSLNFIFCMVVNSLKSLLFYGVDLVF